MNNLLFASRSAVWAGLIFQPAISPPIPCECGLRLRVTRAVWFSVFLGLWLGSLTGVADSGSPEKRLWQSDIAYGPSPRQVLDLYLPPGNGPFPVALFIHGGGWVDGDKVGKLDSAIRDRFLATGIAVVSINYRFIPEAAKDGVFPPVLWPLNDAKRALQFVRLRADDWNLDPHRVVVFGGSAGAFTALWLALSGEQAEPDSSDPVARMSSRVLAVGGFSAQTSLDPSQMRAWVGRELTYGGHAFGIQNFDEFFRRRGDFAEWYPKLSPADLVSGDDPPIYLSYGQGLDVNHPDGNYFTHSPRFGIGFEELAQGKGATCFLQYPGHTPAGVSGDLVGFLISQIKNSAK